MTSVGRRWDEVRRHLTARHNLRMEIMEIKDGVMYVSKKWAAVRAASGCHSPLSAGTDVFFGSCQIAPAVGASGATSGMQ